VGYDQSFIAQCCPSLSPTPAFYAKKACPDSRSCSVANPCMTTCGEVTAPGRCTPCPTYPTMGKCAMRVEEAHWKDRDAPGGKTKVYNVCARFAWTCGDGVCDLDEDCTSCAEDCKTCDDD
jgi:hypothetical protein